MFHSVLIVIDMFALSRNILIMLKYLSCILQNISTYVMGRIYGFSFLAPMLVLVSTSKCAWQYTVKANLQDFIEKNANFTEKVENIQK